MNPSDQDLVLFGFFVFLIDLIPRFNETVLKKKGLVHSNVEDFTHCLPILISIYIL